MPTQYRGLWCNMNRKHVLILAAVLLSGCKEPDLWWDCAGTIIGIAYEDLGPSTAGWGPDGKAIGNDEATTVWVANPPREAFVFKQYETPHAYATWRAELNSEPCKRHIPE
jgi:hypothetical protein